MCFILCDANAVNERAWVSDNKNNSTEAISGMNGKRGGGGSGGVGGGVLK